MPDRYAKKQLEHLIDQVTSLRSNALELVGNFAGELDRVHPEYRRGAENLLHYLAIRKHDLRELQKQLHVLGLSSLGRMEAYVLPTLDAVLVALPLLGGIDLSPEQTLSSPADFQTNREGLRQHTEALLGPTPENRSVRVMVTMPGEAAEDYHLVRDLLRNGMDVMRINCSKEDPSRWKMMIDHLHRAETECGRACQVLMDLAGPNPRTSAIDVSEQHHDRAKKPHLQVDLGERLIFTRDQSEGVPAQRDDNGNVTEPARIGCTLPEVFQHAEPGQSVFYDDGSLSGVIREVNDQGVTVEITYVRKRGKIRGDKGINLPQTRLDLPSLTQKDLSDLDFVVAHADMVGQSFVRTKEDVEHLIAELKERRGEHLGIVLKIETQQAFENLPRLLLSAMQSPPVGVMVARGDMGVELGFSRMAEVQEEILWVCEAAHVPVIWATQVLESLARRGLPSRAEVTDAAMSSRAECVMLNQGVHIVKTVDFLCGVLRRMQDHQEKKQSLLRKLRIAALGEESEE